MDSTRLTTKQGLKPLPEAIVSNLDPDSGANEVSSDDKNQKYSDNLSNVRKNTMVSKRLSKSINFKPPKGIGMLAVTTVNSMKITKKVETMPAKWITGDVSKLDFDEGLVNEDESNKRLVRMFFIMAFVLLIIANILTIQYSLTR